MLGRYLITPQPSARTIPLGPHSHLAKALSQTSSYFFVKQQVLQMDSELERGY